MPALYASGQHDGLAAGANGLHGDDFVVAFLDDLYVRTTKERAHAAFTTVPQAVEEHAGVRTHLGKLRAWCRTGGEAPPDLVADPLGPEVWTADRPDEENGIRVLGTPIGTAAYVAAHAQERQREEERLLHELPELPDLQCAWLLLYFSAAARASRLLRVLPMREVATYVALHDTAMWDTLCKLLEVDPQTPPTQPPAP
jgi:hypothetical protein